MIEPRGLDWNSTYRFWIEEMLYAISKTECSNVGDTLNCEG
jgi:hypothetical protein